MGRKWVWLGWIALILLAAGCKKQVATVAPPPPAPKQNLFVLLPEPEGKSAGIEVRNAAGVQELVEPRQAVRVERPDAPPGQPFTMDEAEVKRLFGAALEVLPAAEQHFTLYFDEGRDELTAESTAQIPAILNAIRERHSTAISVTGHTDTTGTPEANYQLGLRRAQRVVGILLAQGLEASDVFAESHGETDQVVKTERGVAEPHNRRVEVIVR